MVDAKNNGSQEKIDKLQSSKGKKMSRNYQNVKKNYDEKNYRR